MRSTESHFLIRHYPLMTEVDLSFLEDPTTMRVLRMYANGDSRLIGFVELLDDRLSLGIVAGYFTITEGIRNIIDLEREKRISVKSPKQFLLNKASDDQNVKCIRLEDFYIFRRQDNPSLN